MKIRENRINRFLGHVSVDLTTTAGVGPIRNQAACGSCWAFSVVAAMEYAYWKRTSYVRDFSEQQLVDCVYPRDGCQGGWMQEGFDYIKKREGIALENKYPYMAQYTGCRSSTTEFVPLNVSSCFDIQTINLCFGLSSLTETNTLCVGFKR